MDLPILRVHQKSAAATADVIDCVTTGVQNGRGAYHRTRGVGSDNFQSDDAIMVHGNGVRESRVFFKQSSRSE